MCVQKKIASGKHAFISLLFRTGIHAQENMFQAKNHFRKSERARILIPSTNNVIITAPAHARRFQSSKGLAAYWKITTGKFAIGAFMFQDINWLLSAVNSNGAVSPEIRATASK